MPNDRPVDGDAARSVCARNVVRRESSVESPNEPWKRLSKSPHVNAKRCCTRPCSTRPHGMCALSPTCFSVSAPRAMVSTPANAPIGFEPYGPGLPRSASSHRNVPRTPVASLFDQPTLPAAFVLRQSSLVTRSPLAGAVPVNPSERASSTPPPNDHCPVAPAPPARVCHVLWLPPSTEAEPVGGPPCRVVTCTMPPMASLPNSALCGPRTTSTCETSPKGSSEKSKPPPNAFARTPSTSTSV